MEEVEADLVSREERSLDGHSAEGSRADSSIWVSAERASPMFKLNRFPRCFFYEELYGILVSEKIAPLDCIVGVRVEAVIIPQYGGHASLGGDCMAPHGIHLRNDGNVQLGLKFDSCYRRTNACCSATYNDNVVIVMLQARKSLLDLPG